MTSSANPEKAASMPIHAEATDVSFQEDSFLVQLRDGREIKVPIEWFPRLRDAESEQRENWRFIGNGEGIHWPDIDEDISVPELLKSS